MGTCTYANADGAFFDGSDSFTNGYTCPDAATEVCVYSSRRRAETRLEKAIRSVPASSPPCSLSSSGGHSLTPSLLPSSFARRSARQYKFPKPART